MSEIDSGNISNNSLSATNRHRSRANARKEDNLTTAVSESSYWFITYVANARNVTKKQALDDMLAEIARSRFGTPAPTFQ